MPNEKHTLLIDSDPATREETFTIKLSTNTHFLCCTQLFSLQYIEALNGISFLNPYWHLSHSLQIEMSFPRKLSNYKFGFENGWIIIIYNCEKQPLNEPYVM